MSKGAAVALAATAITLLFAAHANAAVIEVTARVRQTNVVRLPPAGRIGDADSTLMLVRDRHGRVIGDMVAECRWVSDSLRLCVGQLSLPLGALALLGTSRTRFIGQYAVVGGTGRYIGAHGVLTFNQIGAGRYALAVTYRK